MNKRLIVGNWKMNKTASEAATLCRQFLDLAKNLTEVDIVFAPPFPALQAVGSVLSTSPYQLAAQNVFWEDEGAYTGEVSCAMLQSLGCRFVIAGHSERRQIFGETNAIVNKKVKAILRNGLHAILCVGETLDERKAGATQTVIEEQVLEGMAGLSQTALPFITIAYEPVWAIGSGTSATVWQIEEVHQFLRTIIGKLFDQSMENLRILYGGSVNTDNASELFASPEINGALIGKACLHPESFVKISRLAFKKSF